MSRRREPRPPAALELKTTRFSGIQIILNSAGRAVLETHITSLFAATPDFFGGEPAVFDCGRLPADAAPPDWSWLAAELKSRGLNPFAVQNASSQLAEAAVAAGLVVLNDAAPTEPAPVNAQSEATASAPEPVAAIETSVPTRFIDKPLRSGQRIHAKGDLVVLAAVSPGAEVIADGSIHVYAPLKGRALAGARGDTNARIFTTWLEAELVSIAGIYRTFDAPLDGTLARRPAQIRLADASQLVIEPL